MADISHLPSYDEKHAPESVEKDDSIDSMMKGSVDDIQMVKEVEAMEERIQLDEATDNEYLVQDAYEVALKVSSRLGHSATKFPTETLNWCF